MRMKKSGYASLVQNIRLSMNRVYAIIIAVIILFSAVLFNYTTFRVVKNALEVEAELASRRVYWLFTSYKYMAESVGTLSRLSDMNLTLDQKNEILSQRAEACGAVRCRMISVGNETYNYDYKAGYGMGDNVYRGDRDYYKHALAGETYIDSPLYSRIDDKLVLTIGSPIWKNGIKDTEVVGVVYLGLDPDILSKITADLAISKHSDALILSNDGTVVANVDTSLIYNQVNYIREAEKDAKYKKSAEVVALMINQQSGSRFIKHNGKLCLVSYTGIEGPEGWSLVLTVPVTDYMWIALVYAVLMGAVAFLTMHFMRLKTQKISEEIANPLNTLTERIKTAAYNGGMPVEDYGGPEEISAITEAMSSIMERLDMAVSENKKVLEYANVSDLIDKQVFDYLHLHYKRYYNLDLIIADMNSRVIVGEVSHTSINKDNVSEDEARSFIKISDRTIGSVIVKSRKGEEHRPELNEAIASFVGELLSKVSVMAFKYSINERQNATKRQNELDKYIQSNRVITNSLENWLIDGEKAKLADEKEELFALITKGVGVCNDIFTQIKSVENEISAGSELGAVEETEYTIDQLLNEIERHVEPKLFNTSIRYTIKATDKVPKKLFGDYKLTARVIYSVYLKQIDYSKSGTTGITVDSTDNGYAKMISFRIYGNRKYSKDDYVKVRRLLSEDNTIKGKAGVASELELDVAAASRQAKLLNGNLDIMANAKNGVVITFTLPQLEVGA